MSGLAGRVVSGASVPDDATTWRRFQDLLPHVNAEATQLHLSREFEVRDLARGVIRYLYQSGDYTSALALTEAQNTGLLPAGFLAMASGEFPLAGGREFYVPYVLGVYIVVVATPPVMVGGPQAAAR